jgi:hypothetical protein
MSDDKATVADAVDVDDRRLAHHQDAMPSRVLDPTPVVSCRWVFEVS